MLQFQVLRSIWLLVVAFVAVAAHAATLAEEVFAVADGPADVATDQHHVGRMTGLAASFYVFLGEERPEPVLVVAVSFLDAGGGATVTLMTGRTTELVGIVNLQQIPVGVADESLG